LANKTNLIDFDIKPAGDTCRFYNIVCCQIEKLYKNGKMVNRAKEPTDPSDIYNISERKPVNTSRKIVK